MWPEQGSEENTSTYIWEKKSFCFSRSNPECLFENPANQVISSEEEKSHPFYYHIALFQRESDPDSPDVLLSIIRNTCNRVKSFYLP